MPPMRYLSDSAKRAELRGVLLFALTFFAVLTAISLAAIFANTGSIQSNESSDKSLSRQAMCQILCEKGVVHHHHLKQTRLNRCLTSTPN
jgi:uncharacterized membrane protein